MLSTRPHPAWPALIALFLLLSFASAATNSTNGSSPQIAANKTNSTVAVVGLTGLQREVSFYLKAGEKADFVPFTGDDGNNYNMVKVGGSEALIFDAANTSINDIDRINSLSSSYVKQLGVPFKQANLNSMQASMTNLSASVSRCMQTYYNFTQGIRNCFIVSAFGPQVCSFVYANDMSQILNLTDDNRQPLKLTPIKQSIDNGTKAMNISMPALQSAVDQLSADFPSLTADVMASDLMAVKNDVTQFQADAAIFNAGHLRMVALYEFRVDAALGRCSLDLASASSIASQAAIASSFPNSTAIGVMVNSFIASRTPQVVISKQVQSHQDQVAALESSYAVLKTALMSVNPATNPAALGLRVAQVRADFEKLKTQTNASSASALTATVDHEIANVTLIINSESAVSSDYAQSSAAINNASLQMALALKKFGPNDPRVTDMQTQLTQLKDSLALREQDLTAARPVSTSDFKSITTNASSLAFVLASMQGRENEIDFSLIGGVVIAIILLVGGFIYLRKLKAKSY